MVSRVYFGLKQLGDGISDLLALRRRA